MLAVIGPDWNRRIAELQSSGDWVRRELEAGLQRRILMVPVLVDDASLPRESDLPASLRKLVEYQVVHLYPQHWKEVAGTLIDELANYLKIPKQQQRLPEPPNLSGDWFDTDGVHLRLEHRGDNVEISLLNNWGRLWEVVAPRYPAIRSGFPSDGLTTVPALGPEPLVLTAGK